MNSKKLGFLAMFVLFGATILVPVLLTDIASADCGSYVRDVVAHCDYVGDLLRCDSSAVRDYDSGTAGDYDRNAARDCDNCYSQYRCNLYGCGWIR